MSQTTKSRIASTVFMVIAFVATLVLGAVAHGQPWPASQPVDPSDPWFVFTSLWTALQHRSWGLGIAAALVLVVLGLRWGAGMLADRLDGLPGEFFAWFKTDRGGALLVLASGVASSAFVALFAGQAVTPQLLLGGLGAGVTAAGGWNVIKRLLAPPDKKPAGGKE